MNEWMNEWMNEEEEVQCNEIRSNNKKGQIQQKKKRKRKNWRRMSPILFI